MAKEIIFNIDVNTDLQEVDDDINSIINSTDTLKKQFKDLTIATQKATDPEVFKKYAKAAGEIKDKIGDANTQINNFSSDTKKLDVVIGSVQGVAGAFATLQGTIALLGVENEDLQKTFVKVQASMAVLNGVQQIAKTLNKDSAVGAQLYAAANKILNSSFLQVNGGLKAFRIALISTGIGAAVVAVGLLIANFDKVKEVVLKFIPGLELVGKWLGEIVQSVTDWVGATSEENRELEKQNALLAKNNLLLDATNDNILNQIRVLEAKGGKEKEIYELQLKYLDNLAIQNNNNYNQELDRIQSLNIKDEDREALLIKLNEENAKRVDKINTDREILEINYTNFLKTESDKRAAENKKKSDDALKTKENEIKAEIELEKKKADLLKELDIKYTTNPYEKRLKDLKKSHEEELELAKESKYSQEELSELILKQDQERINTIKELAEESFKSGNFNELSEALYKLDGLVIKLGKSGEYLTADKGWDAQFTVNIKGQSESLQNLITKQEEFRKSLGNLTDEQKAYLDIQDYIAQEKLKENWDKTKIAVESSIIQFKSLNKIIVDGKVILTSYQKSVEDIISDLSNRLGFIQTKEMNTLLENGLSYRNVLISQSEERLALYDLELNSKLISQEEYNAKVSENELALQENLKSLNKDRLDFYVNTTAQGLDMLTSLNTIFTNKSEDNAKKAFENGKKIQAAQALISTISSAQSAFQSQFLPVPDVSSPIRGGIAAGFATAAGLLRVKAILSAKYNGGGSNVPNPTTPSFTAGSPYNDSGTSTTVNPFVGGSVTTDQVLKVFVVESDITNAQNRVQLIEDKSTGPF